MKINVKIALFSSSFLVLLVLGLAFFVISDIRQRGAEELQTFRANTLNGIKQNLKDLVDVSYETINQNYENLQDKKFLEKYYGLRLKNTIDTVESVLQEYAEQAKSGKYL